MFLSRCCYYIVPQTLLRLLFSAPFTRFHNAFVVAASALSSATSRFHNAIAIVAAAANSVATTRFNDAHAVVAAVAYFFMLLLLKMMTVLLAQRL